MSETNTPSLKIGRIPNRTPVKMTVALEPGLKADIDAYASLYEKSYGEAVASNALVPVMLKAFLASDVGFRRARKVMADD